MNERKQHPKGSIVNWLGLGVLALLVIVLLQLSRVGQPSAEPEEILPPPSPKVTVFSPLPVAVLSPLALPNSPLPTPSPTAVQGPPRPTPSPTELSQVPSAQVDGFSLTVLHTNDTWGYLLPCG